MPEYAAIDLGAESGRVVVGRLDGERVELDLVHRFHNRPLRLPDGMHWNLMSLFAESLTGLGFAGRVDGIGIDAWGVDYALLDGSDRVLGLPFHYRDTRTQGMIDRAHARVPREELYAVAGIQTIRSTRSSSCSPTRARPRSPRRSASRSSPTSSRCG